MVHLFICPTYGRNGSEPEFQSLVTHCKNALTDWMVCRSKNKQKVAEGCFLNKTQTGRSKLNVAAPLPYRVVPYLFWRAWGKQGVSLWALLFPCVWSCLFSFGLQLLIYKMFTTLLQSIWSQTANMQLPLFDYFFFKVHEK